MLLLVRDDRFLVYGDSLYNVGSGSNSLFCNNIYAMGEFYNLAWLEIATKEQAATHEKLAQFESMHLIKNDNRLSFINKCKIIKNSVKQSDIVVAKMSLLQAIVASHYAVKYKKTLVIESGSDLFAALWYHGGGIKYKLAAISLNPLVKYYHRRADYIIYVSKAFLQKKYKSNAKQIGCSDAVIGDAIWEYFHARVKKINSYDYNHEFVLGLVGETQAEYRGHDVLIKTCAALVRKGYKIKVRFLGGGTADKKRIQYAESLDVKDNIEFCGRLPHNEVVAWFKDIDIMVMPTKVESLGRAVIEAMYTACPVIGTRTTALRELLQDDCLVQPTDWRSIAGIIEKMIRDRSYMLSCAEVNFKKAQEYSCGLTNKIRRDFYQELIDENGKNTHENL